ncbi:sugar phosphate isomerase/epimerase [Oscillospiraceae bacterium HV4-5-C5C]|nr:sugar phosphate isomerase/epimerase [Oscillospiraceae bacterium HV4-5-C5C]
MKNIMISGFADEICPDFSQQLKTVSQLGMKYISLRSANGINVADMTADLLQNDLLPILRSYNIAVSSLGSPIGKIDIHDDAAFEKQLQQLETLCQLAALLNCAYIRIFSFYTPENEDPDRYKAAVLKKMSAFIEIAQEHQITLIHENEKDIFGDTGRRCQLLLQELKNPWFKAAFDFANFVQCGEEPDECWELLHEDVVYIHIKDALHSTGENVLCGRGDGQIEPLLRRAIKQEGYQGFLTLEPHLVQFDSLKQLEKKSPDEIIKNDQAASGAEAYRQQYEALSAILERIDQEA